VADGWLDDAVDLPGDLSVLVVRDDLDRDVVLTQRIVVQGLTVHVHDERVADRAHRIAFGRHEHPGAVDGHVAVGRGEDLEDRGWARRDRALHLDALSRHGAP
jgi:hypothetical protein